jgi:glutamate-1-semialdehyde 2,1-aminomutase
MSALLARGATGRDKIVKFEGCYHGHADSLLVRRAAACSPSAIRRRPACRRTSSSTRWCWTITTCADRRGLRLRREIACVIVEPVAGNMNLIKGTREFLQALRDLCTQHGALLIFDEVMCGFRVALGGAQALYGIKPDLTALGKVIGGGMPVAAFGGSAA